ncbi:MAG TPA: 3-dehydroquinate synthase, partial [Roseiflexaceae bacterium]|nr:3-dehydroquinate synthase [Roseiflexaceae bacterium]
GIELGERSYPILIGAGLIGDHELLRAHIKARDVLIVTNETVAPLYLATVTAALGERRIASVILPDGEEHKTLESFARILDALVQARMNRDAAVIALGGGVIGDMAGFAAASYQRGIDYVQMPTTLLAQVDSSVGGKTAVNHREAKNMIGAFYQPRCVIADTATLATLADREYRAGLAEVVKYGLIHDVEFFDWLEANAIALTARDQAAVRQAIRRSCEIKAAIVGVDEREHGLRAILNLGHTFGHAIETATGYGTWLHGEAVAAGMVMAADLSQRLGWLPAADRLRTEHVLARCGLPIEAPRIGAARGFELMGMDKKVLDRKLRLVLLRKLGQADIVGDYSAAALEATLQHYFD